ncbi:MAG: HAMP domain-containing protein [Acidobacteria bacterium]|nr:HAMP domain-containing protein [Acidobacteriota bacterium]
MSRWLNSDCRKMTFSLRTRLTFWYVGVLAVILLGYGTSIYFYFSAKLLSEIDGGLLRQVQRIEASLNAVAQGFEIPHERTDRLTLAPDLVELIDPEGRVADSAAEGEDQVVPINPDTLRRAAQTPGPVMEILTTRDGKRMRVATWRSFGEDGKLDCYIRAGYLLSDLKAAQERMLTALGGALLIALGLAGYGGWLLAGRALRPVDRVTAAARAITATNLKERVDVPPSSDELSRLAQTFNEMISRLDEAFDRERRFTDEVSHELRTPLAVLRSEIEITLHRDRSPEEYRAAMRRLLDEILKLGNLVEDLLMLARSDTGHLTLERQELRLDQLGEEMTDFVRPLAEERAIALEFSPSPVPLLVVGDPRRLRQLTLNLLGNALKFTPSGGRVQVHVSAENGDAALFVEDSGRGIPAADLPHVLDRFFRRKQEGEDGSSGLGLGLAISKWIAEAHGGRIEIRSEVGKGTRVTVRLPRYRA